MLTYLKKKLQQILVKPREQKPPQPRTEFSKNLAVNVENIHAALANCIDVQSRPIKIGRGHQVNGYIFFVKGMIDTTFAADNIISPLILLELNKTITKPVHQQIYDQLLTSGSIELENNLESFITKVLSGNVGLLMEGQRTAFSIEAKGWKERTVEESPTESVIKGSRVGFIENIRANTAMLRRMLKSPRLKIIELSLGTISNTKINIAYIEGVVKKGLLEEAKQRLERIDIDGILNVGILQEMLDDSTWSIFSESYSTERPDRACSCLLEGRIVILLDNSPFVIVAPSTISQLVQSVDDYSSKYIVASLTRIIRFIALHITLILPGLYVAFFSYHHEMIPTELLKSIAGAREQVPLPIFAEMLLLELAFEILREAGIRLPRAVGQAVSIVGALVIGQAAVSARLVSPPSIIVVALTAISSFTIPLTEGADSYRMLRFAVLIAAGVMGIPGMIAVLLIILVHVAGLRSFGVPYLAPANPVTLSDWKDFMLRLPMSFMKTRPKQTGKANYIRQGKWNKEKGGK